MQRTQTRLRIGFGLVAMVAVLALVAFMATVGSNSDTNGVYAAGPTQGGTPTPGGPTPTPDPGFKVLATVKSVTSKAEDQSTAVLVINKEGAQTIDVQDNVIWKGERWKVTARGASDVSLKSNDCGFDDPADYPKEQKHIYEWPLMTRPCSILSGISDLEVNPGANAIYHCITRTDHDDKTNVVEASTQCYVDFPGAGDPANVLNGVNVPGEGPDILSGPPPPPPYTIGKPNHGEGVYYPGGHADCGNVGTGTCLVTITCFPDIGVGLLGPNLLSKTIVLDPDDTPDQNSGFSDSNPGRSIAQCDALDSSGFPVAPNPFGSFAAIGDQQTSWRLAAIAGAGSARDFDGDGCTDAEELDESGFRPKGCGDDPYNPLDSNVTEFSGAYSILVRVLRAEETPGFGGIYFSCIADIQQTGTGKTDGDLQARAFCYTDSFFSVVNAQGYPGVTGDGFPGGSPPYLAIPIACSPTPSCNPPVAGDAETNCDRGIILTHDNDEDGDGTPNDGCPSEGFGDVDSKHTVLTGRVNNTTNNLELRGCFVDEDVSSSIGTVYVEMAVNAYTGNGTVDIWTEQNVGICTGTYAFGTYATATDPQVGPPGGSFAGAKIAIVRQPGGKDRDTDQDGIPNAVEMRDNGAQDCGLRDPFNPYDWYDVNQDGVIDLLNDILGVIQHYAPGGAPPYDANWDRPPSMTGGAGHWNRGAPDGVIDLLNDILGVIQQYHPGQC